ncbi:MAG: Polyribonucleotide 5'-hydroxyl-kinase [Promethearchaeota archaeon]|nr:MAG: Polyribonucleotide 5'-hydroxyl-kinase [Candidatus Lokiarchaeota archaeon]
MIEELKKGETLLAKGPTRVNLLKGKLEIFGKIIDASSKESFSSLDNMEEENALIIPSAKQYPLYCLEDSELEIYTNNKEENLEIIEDNSIPDDWIKIKDKILSQLDKGKKKPLKIMVLGLSYGKTTLIKYLANNFIREGYEGAYLDSDLGQQLIYVPCTINVGKIKNPIITGEDIETEFTRFIGSTFPKGNLKFIISHLADNLVKDFNQKYEDADFCLIDTDGWIKKEPGILYKSFFIKTINPDILIVFEDEEVEELETIEDKVKSEIDGKIMHIKGKNEFYYEKNKNERRFLRQSQFSRAFEEFRKITIPLGEIEFIKYDYDEEENEIVEREIEIDNLIELPYHYVIIALLDEDSKIIEIGLLFSVNLEKEYVLIFSDLTYKEQLKVDKILLGSLRLSTKGNHQGYLYL